MSESKPHCDLSEDAEKLIQDGWKLGGYWYHGGFVWTFGKPQNWTYYGMTPNEAIEDALKRFQKQNSTTNT